MFLKTHDIPPYDTDLGIMLDKYVDGVIKNEKLQNTTNQPRNGLSRFLIPYLFNDFIFLIGISDN